MVRDSGRLLSHLFNVLGCSESYTLEWGYIGNNLGDLRASTHSLVKFTGMQYILQQKIKHTREQMYEHKVGKVGELDE